MLLLQFIKLEVLVKLIKDQVESLRYINHLWPILILRLYVSYFFFSRYGEKLNGGFLSKPKISALIDEFLYSLEPPVWVETFFVDYVQENWALSAGVIVNLEWLLGFIFLVGFLNRPGAIVATFYLYVIWFISGPVEQAQIFPLMVILLSLLVFGSGRVGGLDYFFYKRQRGLIW